MAEKSKGGVSDWERILVLYHSVIQTMIFYVGCSILSFFSAEKKPAPSGEDDGLISPTARELLM